MAAIGEASWRSGVGIETIRYYERAGVLPRAARMSNGRRDYSDGEIAWLRFLKTCRNLGFPLAEARRLLDLARADVPDCAAVAGFCHSHRQGIHRRIAELQALDAALAALAADCEAGNPRCPMIDRIIRG